jgi:hypothetical protein
MEITRYSIDGGGVFFSHGDNVELSGTIGQPDAGILTGGAFGLVGGFWFETPPGDCNADGNLSLLDHDAFVKCMNGPSSGMEAGCECFDVNNSGAIDLSDFSESQKRFLGVY